MSWSVDFTGTPKAIAKALHDHAPKLTGDSKREFEEAKPQLISMLELNFSDRDPNLCLRLTASGHKTFGGDGKNSSAFYVNLQYVGSVVTAT